MARTYAKLYVSVWGSDFRALTREAQHLYFLLVSNPKLSSAGCVVCQPRKWAKYAADCTGDEIAKALDELIGARYVLHDDDTDEVLIRSFIRHDRGFRNPFLRKSIETAVQGIESERLRETARLELAAVVEEATSSQVKDSQQDCSEDRYEDRPEDSEQATYEPNYRLHTSTSPSELPTSVVNAVADSVDVPEQVAPKPDDDKGKIIERIVTRCASLRTEQARPKNPTGYHAAVVADMLAKEADAIRTLLAEKPFYATMPDRAASWYEATRTKAVA